jgi:superfamily I DNA and/or RNA helicase
MVKQGYPCSFLDYQYLINPSISFFPSFKFYDAQLKSGINQSQLPLIGGFDWPNKDVGIAIINTDQREEHTNGSIQNTR